MPNWVTNKCTLTGSRKECKEIYKNFFNTEEKTVKFDYIIPEPEYSNDREWFNWRIHNWDSKWLGDLEYLDYEEGSNKDKDQDEVYFVMLTPWSAPYKVFKALLEKYSSINLYVEFADEDIGYNCGIITATRNDGKVNLTVESKENDIDFAEGVYFG